MSDGPECCHCNYGELPCTCPCHVEDAGDDYRLSSATRKEWAERALKAEERVKELEAERDRLREALTSRAVDSLKRLIEWLDESEDNGALLLASMTDDDIRRARAALNTEGDT